MPSAGERDGLGEPSDEPEPAGRRWGRLRRIDPLTALVVLAVGFFVLVGIGSPLLGQTTLLASGELKAYTPYRDAPLPPTGSHTINMGDTIDAAVPTYVLFGEELREGRFASWNPYAVGGSPLAATPNYAVLSPASLPYVLLPGWLAPAYVKLLETIVAVGGTFLFLRRLRLGRAAALLGGMAFASSAFVVVWTNWQQTRVAVFIPVLFWALERLVQRRQARDVALVGLAVAAMLFGGFPAVTGYALLTGGCYLVARALAEYRDQWRRAVGVLAAGAAGAATGVALTAAQLLPFAYFMSRAQIVGRGQNPDDHIYFELLLTTIAPNAFGGVERDDPPLWFHSRIFLEQNAYVGGAVVALALIAVLRARAGRALLPRAAWTFLVVATGAWATVIFVGGPPLAVLQELPVLFSTNFVGRGRSVLGLLVAVLAAVGFDLLVRRARHRADAPDPTATATAPVTGVGGRRWVWAVGVWLVVALVAGRALLLGRRWAFHAWEAWRLDPSTVEHFAAHLTDEVAFGLGFVVATLLAAAWLHWTPAGRWAPWPRCGSPRWR